MGGLPRGWVAAKGLLAPTPKRVPGPASEPEQRDAMAGRQSRQDTLCCAIPVSAKSGFRPGFRSDSGREDIKIGLPAGRKADFEAPRVRPKSGPEAPFPARKQYPVSAR